MDWTTQRGLRTSVIVFAIQLLACSKLKPDDYLPAPDSGRSEVGAVEAGKGDGGRALDTIEAATNDAESGADSMFQNNADAEPADATRAAGSEAGATPGGGGDSSAPDAPPDDTPGDASVSDGSLTVTGGLVTGSVSGSSGPIEVRGHLLWHATVRGSTPDGLVVEGRIR